MDKKFIDKYLVKYLPKDNSILSRAIRYSVLANGKRFRPILCLEAAKLFGSRNKGVIPAACAIEMIHAFTLIHDDLPAMDNSELRRGQLTCHKKYGEDIAILAGDALNTSAFVTIAKYCDKDIVARISKELGEALIRVVEGQVIDLESEGKRISLNTLQKMHLLKTAALIEASVKIGAILANASEKGVNSIARYGKHLGLAFQIADDILDTTSDTQILGKPAKLDEKNNKSTYVSLLGIKKAKELALSHKNSAIRELNKIGGNLQYLIDIAEFAVRRVS